MNMTKIPGLKISCVGISLVLFLMTCGGEKKGVLTFVDIRGNDIRAGSNIGIFDPLMIKMSGLTENELYRVRVYDSAAQKLYSNDLVLRSDGDGNIPDTAVAFLDTVERAQVTSKAFSNPKGGMLAPLFRTTATGEWCVKVYKNAGGAVSDKECLTVTDTGKRLVTTDSEGKSNRSFLLNLGRVYVSGSNFTPSSSVDLYLLNNRADFLQYGAEDEEKETLLDVRGLDPVTFSVDDNGDFSGSFWESPGRLGLYDIVVDADQDGLWDKEGDYLMSSGFVPGFGVQNRGVTTFSNKAQLSCGKYASDYCTYKDFFLGENLFSFLNPLTQPATPYEIPGPKLHVVPHQDTWLNGDTLKDLYTSDSSLAGMFMTPLKIAAATGSYVTGNVMAYPSGVFVPGCYDIVIDTDENDRYDYGQDYLDNTDVSGESTCGFVIPGGEGAPAVTITAITDGNGAVLQDGGDTSAKTLKLQGMVTTSDTVLASYVTVEVNDADNDNVSDLLDNCPNDYNPDQRDLNSDGLGNECDPDFPEPQCSSDPAADECQDGYEQPDVAQTADKFNQISFDYESGSFNTGYFPIYNGTNRVTIYFMDSQKRVGYQRISIDADQGVVTRKIEIELTWTKPLTATSSDMDLHLLKPGGAYFDYGTKTDCFFQTCKLEEYPQGLEWDGDANSANNPKLEIDCVSDCVRVERIYMDEVDTLGAYRLYVDAYSGSGVPTVNIYIDGFPAPSGLTPPCTTLESSTDGVTDTWYVGYFNREDLSISFVTDDAACCRVDDADCLYPDIL